MFNHHRHQIRARIHESGESIASPSSLVSVSRPDSRPSEANGLNLKELLEQSRFEGYTEGISSVVAEQERSRTSAIENAARQLLDASNAALADRTAIVDGAIADAIDLSLEVVRTIFGRELKLVDNPTREAIEQALRIAPEGENFVVRVPTGCELDMPRLLELTHGAPISIKEDPSIRLGECIVEVAACRIDRQIESALSRVRVELERLVEQNSTQGAA